MIPQDIINCVNSKQPPCELWVYGRTFSCPSPKKIVAVQDLPGLVALSISVPATSVDTFFLLQWALRSCPNLRMLDLNIVHETSHPTRTAPIIRGFQPTNGRKLPSLGHLILSGFRAGLQMGIEDTWREALYLSQLESLYFKDPKEQAFNWWQETSLVSLKSFRAPYPLHSHTHLNAASIPLQIKSFFGRNWRLKDLELFDFMDHIELLWLAPLGSSLQALRIHERPKRPRRHTQFDRRRFLTHDDISLLGRLLPNLDTLKLNFRATPNWPYGTLTAIAIAFPRLRHLEIHFDICYSAENNMPQHGYPLATMNRAASSWSHLWNILASQDTATRNRATGNILSPDQPTIMCQPHLKTLEVIVGPPGPYVHTSSLFHRFQVTLAERAEEAEQGIATLISKEVEDLLQEKNKFLPKFLVATGSEVERVDEDLAKAMIEAEIGTEDWSFDICAYPTSAAPHWGMRRTVRPSEMFHQDYDNLDELWRYY